MSGSVERIPWNEKRVALDEAIRRAKDPSPEEQAAADKWHEEHPGGPTDEEMRARGRPLGRGMGEPEREAPGWTTRADDGPLGRDA